MSILEIVGIRKLIAEWKVYCRFLKIVAQFQQILIENCYHSVAFTTFCDSCKITKWGHYSNGAFVTDPSDYRLTDNVKKVIMFTRVIWLLTNTESSIILVIFILFMYLSFVDFFAWLFILCHALASICHNAFG